MKDRNNPSNSKRTTGYCFRWFVSIAILTFLPMIAAMADNETPSADPAWVTQAQTATVGTDTNSTDIVVTESTGEGNPTTYTVKTATGLAWIAWVTNEGKTYPETANTSTVPNYENFYPASAGFEGCIVELADDISLTLSTTQNTAGDTNESWVPIGRPEQNLTNYSFKGTFNGNNKTISDLSITKEYTNYYCIGLFGYIEGGSVNDLTVEGEIKLNSYTNTTISKYIGGIAGYSKGNINNCHNKCEIDYGSAGENKDIIAGGIVGKIDNTNCSITNCSNQGKISGTKGGYCYVGGIAGIININSEAISNCFNSGEIDATAQTACFAGGIVGQNSVQLSNCYSTGKITAIVNNSSSTSNCYAGGIAGSNNRNTITNCYSTGAVSAAHSGKSDTYNSNSCYVGGIVGYSSSQTTISNCLALNKSTDGNSAAISAIATNVPIKIGRIVGDYYTIGDPSYDTKLSGNYASTLTTMPAGHTYDKGVDKKDGANIYLEDDLADILDAGISAPATSPWAYSDDNLPTLNVWTSSPAPQQSNLSKATYLANKPAALDLSNAALTGNITITKNDAGEWQYKVGDNEPQTVFSGVIKQSNPQTPFAHSITVKELTEATTGQITLSGKINISTTEEKALLLEKNTGLIIADGTTHITATGTNGIALYLKDNATLTIADEARIYLAAKSYSWTGGNSGKDITGNLINWTFFSGLSSGNLNIYLANDKERTTTYASFNLTNADIKSYATNVSSDTEYTLWHEKEGEAAVQMQGVTNIYDETGQTRFKVNDNGIGLFSYTKPVIPVTLTQPDKGGLISVFYNNAALSENSSGVVHGAKLQLKAYPIAGYKFEKYTVTTTFATENSQPTLTEITIAAGEYTVPKVVDPQSGSSFDITNITVTGSFKKDETSATTSTTTEVATTTDDIPATVNAPTAAVDPNNTTASSSTATIKLISGDLKEQEHKTSLKEELQSELGSTSNMIFAEIALVEIINKDGTEIMKPIQPNAGTTVHIVYPYPAGLDSKSTFVIVHLKTDGTTEVYKESPDASKGEQQLTKTARGLEFAVSSFSPFGITWKAYSAPSGGNDDNDDGDYTPPVYYTVIIPAVEGATTDPVAGAYEVEAWDSFGFYLTLEPAYDQSAPVVTTDRGETLSPRSSDGKYIVKYVRNDIAIMIDGIVPNYPPVANEVLTAGTRVWTERQMLCISTDTPAQATVIDLNGRIRKVMEVPAGETKQTLSPGVYIIHIHHHTVKIFVP